MFNALAAVLFLIVAYLVVGTFTGQPGDQEAVGAFAPAGKPVQIDVLNGCGVPGIASKVTAHLRRRGFDVVEMRNYKSFDMSQTLVIDRVGNLSKARQVARVLGVVPRNIIQEINPDYFVDVSVVIGRDYPTLTLTE